jgi:hypothetical protein
VLKPAGANSIDAFLIFLHLLERNAECVGKFCAQAEHEAAHAYTGANVFIGRVR